MADPIIRIPWPDKLLSPNARADRRAIAGLRKRYRQAGWAATYASGYRGLNLPAVHVRITFHPPDKRRRDLDNMLSSVKNALDGIADATGIDDSRWEITIRRGEKVKGGAVLVEIGPPSASTFIPYLGVIS